VDADADADGTADADVCNVRVACALSYGF